MKQSILIKKTDKFVLIYSYLVGRILRVDAKQQVSYSNTNIGDLDLGKKIREKLSESHSITEELFMDIWKHRNELDEILQKKEEEIIKKCGYKNKNAFQRDISFLSVDIRNNILFITPLHQDGLDSFETVRDKDGQGVEFEYPVNLSDEELGKAVKDAFEYCTSIYRK
ncbi:contact-dependent growth inhibition system immunity protein [Pasteurella bettyae]|uniref:PF07262 family protein n=1 Tax=Pasteurella bettyae CCUG 2042 TaxID=1095749 RepID=I3DGP4_9PAST|nr:contact-dependent growth inhibition system immunity protein [Pasteurella bettyae]EIJ70887.1 PF07262 family protein [Pasteurella bettyae CCUG 2042]SUB22684.1 Protein of uncharacterised function (DUF1436) [Pasteurella bettyae]